MSQVRTNLVVGTVATLAAMAYMTLRERMREKRLQVPPQAENRWENEGGNVPEVALENGTQGQSQRTARPVVATVVDDRQSFPFPRA
jgi:hypothetical protein